MKVIQGETTIAQSPGGGIVLTSHRVRLLEGAIGQSELRSVMLDQVVCCSLVTKSNFLLLYAAIAVALLGLLFRQWAVAIVGGGVLAFLYLQSRKEVLSVASAGGAVEVETSGQTRDSLIDFIDAVEEARFGFISRSDRKLGA